MEWTEVEMILIIGNLNSLIVKSMDMLKQYDSRQISATGYVDYMPVSLIRNANTALIATRDTLEKIRDIINDNTDYSAPSGSQGE